MNGTKDEEDEKENLNPIRPAFEELFVVDIAAVVFVEWMNDTRMGKRVILTLTTRWTYIEL